MAGKGLGTYYKGQSLCLSMLSDPVYCVLWRKFAINYALKIKLSHCFQFSRTASYLREVMANAQFLRCCGMRALGPLLKFPMKGCKVKEPFPVTAD